MGHAPVASHRVEEDVFQGMAYILMVLEEEKKVCVFFSIHQNNDQYSPAMI